MLRNKLVIAVAFACGLLSLSSGLNLPPLSRRQLLTVVSTGVVAAPSGAVLAFDNAMPEAAKYSDRPKRRGPKPTDLGVKLRQTNDGDKSDIPSLKSCTGGSPNCFSTTGDSEIDIGNRIDPWRPPKGQARDKSVEQLNSALANYKPGQSGIDGAGFKIVTNDNNGYWYVQYESLRNGYIDDLEWSLNEDGTSMLVRSSSRVGYLDFGVNAKRLNALARPLKQAGWDISLITADNHGDYCVQNAGAGITPKQTCEAQGQ